MPSDVRKVSDSHRPSVKAQSVSGAPPQILLGAASLNQKTNALGKAEPFRTSGGIAAKRSFKPESAQSSFPVRRDLSANRRVSLQLLPQSADRLSLREYDAGFQWRQTPSSSWARRRLCSCRYRSSSASPSSRARLCRQGKRATPGPKTTTPPSTRSTSPPAADSLSQRPWPQTQSFLRRVRSSVAPAPAPSAARRNS